VRQQNRKAIKSRALWADQWPGSAFSLSNLQIAISKLICPQVKRPFLVKTRVGPHFGDSVVNQIFSVIFSAINNA
jgi:hypothetical protein